MMIPQWLQNILAFCFFVSLGLLVLLIINYKRRKIAFYAKRNYKLTHEHPDILVLGGMGEGQFYVSSLENGHRFVRFFKARSDALRFYLEERQRGHSVLYGELTDDLPMFPAK